MFQMASTKWYKSDHNVYVICHFGQGLFFTLENSGLPAGLACDGTISELNVTTVPEGASTSESGHGNGLNEEVTMDMSLEFQLSNFCDKD